MFNIEHPLSFVGILIIVFSIGGSLVWLDYMFRKKFGKKYR